MSGLETLIDKLASTVVDEVKEVSFAGKGLKLDSQEDAKDVVQAIRDCPGMTTLCLSGNTIGVEAAKAIAKALESQPNFKIAQWKDMFTQRTEHEIPDALNYLSSGIMLANAHLEYLDLSDNAFGPRGLKGIVELLKSPPCYTLKELRLNNNGLGTSGAKMLASALQQCLSNSRKDGKSLQLKVFICGRNRLENEGSLALAEFLKDLGTLQHLAIPQNGIYHEGIAGLAVALAANKNLRILNLEDNSLTEKGARALATCLPMLENIEVINFGDCLLRSGGAKVFAEAIQDYCLKLRELYLGYNEINADGGKMIIDAIINKPHLEKIVLNGNQFGSHGCEMIPLMMEGIGKGRALASLSEDEGTAEESDEGDNSDDSEEEEDHDDENLTYKPHFSPCTNLIKEKEEESGTFTANPTPRKLNFMYEFKSDILSELPENPTLQDYFNLFCKVASVVKLNDDKTEQVANYYTDQILSLAFKIYSPEDIWTFNNEFLVLLGFIKGEDKKKTVDIDLTGAFIVLKHAVQQSYFHTSTKDMLQFFLSKPLRCGDVSLKVKHSLLQVLY